MVTTAKQQRFATKPPSAYKYDNDQVQLSVGLQSAELSGSYFVATGSNDIRIITFANLYILKRSAAAEYRIHSTIATKFSVLLSMQNNSVEQHLLGLLQCSYSCTLNWDSTAMRENSTNVTKTSEL